MSLFEIIEKIPIALFGADITNVTIDQLCYSIAAYQFCFS